MNRLFSKNYYEVHGVSKLCCVVESNIPLYNFIINLFSLEFRNFSEKKIVKNLDENFIYVHFFNYVLTFKSYVQI